jgi:hypothetical protein
LHVPLFPILYNLILVHRVYLCVRLVPILKFQLGATHLTMSISDSTVETACLPHRKEKRVAVVAFLLLSLFGFSLMLAHHRRRSAPLSFRAYDALQAPQVLDLFSSYA